MKKLFFTLALIFVATSFAQSQTDSNKALVLSLLTQVFDGTNPSLVNDYYHPGYIQHTPGIEDNRTGVQAAIQGMDDAGMSVKRTLGHVVAQGDLVAVHSRVEFMANGEAMGGSSIVVDIFRVEDGKVIEHWDVTQEETPASETASGNSMLEGGGNVDAAVSAGELGRNRATVRAFIEEGFAGDAALLDSLFGAEYIQHNPGVPNGKEVVLGFLENGGFPAYVKRMIAEGDIVFAHVYYPDFNNAVVDIFRLDDNGKIIEHWDVGQEIPDERKNNGMF